MLLDVGGEADECTSDSSAAGLAAEATGSDTGDDVYYGPEPEEGVTGSTGSDDE